MEWMGKQEDYHANCAAQQCFAARPDEALHYLCQHEGNGTVTQSSLNLEFYIKLFRCDDTMKNNLHAT
jgi:hypothetical protein